MTDIPRQLPKCLEKYRLKDKTETHSQNPLIVDKDFIPFRSFQKPSRLLLFVTS